MVVCCLIRGQKAFLVPISCLSNIYTVRKSFREFQKSVYIHQLLHKIFCKEGLYISEILWAFRICAISKCQTNNKVYIAILTR